MPTVQTSTRTHEKGGSWFVAQETFHDGAPKKVRYLLLSGRWSQVQKDGDPPFPEGCAWFPTNAEASRALQARTEQDAQGS